MTAKMKNQVLALLIVFAVVSLSVIEPSLATSEVKNTWATKTSIPQLDGEGRAATVDGKIYVMGGSINYMYDPATDNWTQKAPMPTPRHWFGIAVYQNKIYTIGGTSGWSQEAGTIYSGANEVYDPSTDTWENKTSMPTIRQEEDATIVNGQIHLIVNRTHDVYEIATDSWTNESAMPYPYPAYMMSSTNFKDRIYIIGWNLTQIYDPVSDSWSLRAPLPTPLYNVAACKTTGIMAAQRIYVFGGQKSFFDATNTTQVYNPQNDTWTLGALMPTARSALAVVVVDDVIYAIGGSGLVFQPTETVNERYFPFGYGTPDPSY